MSDKTSDDNPLTRAKSKILDAAEIIFAERASEKDAAYLARQLVQATLPHTNPGDVPAWSRTNGQLTLTIHPDGITKRNGPPAIPTASFQGCCCSG